jgi:hypothetical protein
MLPTECQRAANRFKDLCVDIIDTGFLGTEWMRIPGVV